MVNVKVDLTIRDNKTGNYYRIPVLPETISYNDGDAIKDTVKVIDMGNVDFHSGVDLDGMEWSSFFPARYDSGYCTTSTLLKPIEYRNLFSGWKDAGTSLQLVCPAAGINKNMVLNTFKWELKGFEGDINYTASFKERKVIKPVKLDKTAIIPQKQKPGAGSRNPIPAKIKPSTYTVKSGDTITKIAKTYGITPWQTLYEKNKAVIGPDPGKLQIGKVLKL